VNQNYQSTDIYWHLLLILKFTIDVCGLKLFFNVSIICWQKIFPKYLNFFCIKLLCVKGFVWQGPSLSWTNFVSTSQYWKASLCNLSVETPKCFFNGHEMYVREKMEFLEIWFSKFLLSISPTFYVHLFNQYSFTKKMQTKTLSTKFGNRR